VENRPYVEGFDDPCMTLDDWIMVLLVLREAFGGDTKLRTDAGYNNVSMVLVQPAPPIEETRIAAARP